MTDALNSPLLPDEQNNGDGDGIEMVSVPIVSLTEQRSMAPLAMTSTMTTSARSGAYVMPVMPTLPFDPNAPVHLFETLDYDRCENMVRAALHYECWRMPGLGGPSRLALISFFTFHVVTHRAAMAHAVYPHDPEADRRARDVHEEVQRVPVDHVRRHWLRHGAGRIPH